MRALSALSNEELAVLARNGDKKARELLITRNMGWVHTIANRQSKRLRHLTSDDLAQEGVFGLARAIDKYDETRGVRFLTYADHWVRAAIRRAIRGSTQEKSDGIPIGGEELVRMPNPVYDEHLREKKLKRSKSLDAPVHSGNNAGDAGQIALVDLLEDSCPSIDVALVENEERALVRRVLDRIVWNDLRLRELIERRVLADDPETLAAFAEEWGLSRERVRQLETKVLRMIGLAIIAEKEKR